MDIVVVDGSRFEGGGAMIRQSLGLSMLLGKPFRMTNIRVNRPKPGLSWQHLTALNAAHQICDARIVGNSLGSTEISFFPGAVTHTRINLDIGTAGSTTLLLQSLLLPAYFSGKDFHVTVRGGTDVAWSIPVDYFQHVLMPQLRKFGDASLRVMKRGFYPKGDGLVTFSVKGKFPLATGAPRIKLMEQGDPFKISGISFASADLQPTSVAESQEKAARIMLGQLGVPMDCMLSYTSSLSSGSGVVLWMTAGGKEGLDPLNPVLLGASALGEQKLKAEYVGEEAALSLKKVFESRAACDEFLADQLIPFLALVGGEMRTDVISDHVRSNIYIVESFTGVKFEIDEAEKIIRCEKSFRIVF
jgi:RNA 3'-phosphate cyclase